MKLTVFHSGDGDCLLLTSSDGHHALVDGGRSSTFRKHTEPVLAAMAAAKTPLDLVVVSHIDADHISGILVLLRAYAAWELFEFQTSAGNNERLRDKPPPGTAPPRIAQLWHNSWRAQLGDLAEPVQALAGSADVALAMSSVEVSGEALTAVVEGLQDLAESIPDGIELLHLVEDDTSIPLNRPFKKLVISGRRQQVEPLGKVSLHVLGPAQRHIDALREEWRQWLESTGTGEAVAAVRRRELSGPGVGEDLVQATRRAVEVIAHADPGAVTPPNRASILLLAEEGDQTCLLTGDAAQQEILEGLKAAKRITNRRGFHCDILKVQHHGSENNLDQEFTKAVTADHYVFCGNGAHSNPSPSVVRTITESRKGDGDDRPYTMWFNCSPARTDGERRAHLKAAIAEAKAATRGTDRVRVEVLDGRRSAFEIDLDA